MLHFFQADLSRNLIPGNRESIARSLFSRANVYAPKAISQSLASTICRSTLSLFAFLRSSSHFTASSCHFNKQIFRH
ncbi:hypothetical protein L596_007226 [Steinernema carpocapsae]|uniref:Uncharacterized protein n=1 Tax=Steinernema carpocapsae TaxID=34508 RepID=A0A4U5P9N0_STECR|nr:hypothetical protein L596_007226 [Steinernema carpocapsae]